MLIRGKWWPCPDEVSRPTVRANLLAADGRLVSERFLVDSAADRTVFSAALQADLQLPGQPPPPALSFQGIGGRSPFVVVSTVLALDRDDGGVANVRGQFAAFIDPLATDLSILGRDVLDNFDVILSRRRDDVLLLAPNHQYVVMP
jgi:Aspartyl protease